MTNGGELGMEWTHRLTGRAKRLVPSIISEMMRLAAGEGVVSFTAGQPSADLYPTNELVATLGESLRGFPEGLAYPQPLGDDTLRRWIASWLVREEIAPAGTEASQVLLTTGSQQGLSMLAQLFIESGSRILVEDPSYPEALLTFGREGAEFVPVPIEPDGPDIEALERALRSGPCAFFYTIPSFQNPTGYTTSTEKKRAVLELTARYGVPVVEDDPYFFLRYEGVPPETYLALSGGEGVLYLGSFSKIVAPGVRCGFMVLPPELADRASMLRVTLEIGLPAFLQRGLAILFDSSFFPSHLARLRRTYGARRDGLVQAVEGHLVPLGFRYTIPQGGFFLWGRKKGIDALPFAFRAVRDFGVGVIPGSIFSVDERAGKEWLRLSFASVSPEESEVGCRRLAEAFEKDL